MLFPERIIRATQKNLIFPKHEAYLTAENYAENCSGHIINNLLYNPLEDIHLKALWNMKLLFPFVLFPVSKCTYSGSTDSHVKVTCQSTFNLDPY